MKIDALPSLTAKGWVTDLPTIVDEMLGCVFTSDGNQSLLYGNGVVSIPWIISTTMPDLIACTSRLETELARYFMDVFEYATVDVTRSDAGASLDLDGAIDLVISIEIVDTGERYQASALTSIVNSVFNKWIKFNNTGQTN